MIGRIIAVPAGQAPEDIRRCWLGVILNFTYPTVGYETDLFDPTRRMPKRDLYITPTQHALNRLAIRHPSAARWFRENAQLLPHLSFGIDEVKILSSEGSVDDHTDYRLT